MHKENHSLSNKKLKEIIENLLIDLPDCKISKGYWLTIIKAMNGERLSKSDTDTLLDFKEILINRN